MNYWSKRLAFIPWYECYNIVEPNHIHIQTYFTIWGEAMTHGSHIESLRNKRQKNNEKQGRITKIQNLNNLHAKKGRSHFAATPQAVRRPTHGGPPWCRVHHARDVIDPLKIWWVCARRETRWRRSMCRVERSAQIFPLFDHNLDTATDSWSAPSWRWCISHQISICRSRAYEYSCDVCDQVCKPYNLTIVQWSFRVNSLKFRGLLFLLKMLKLAL